MTPMAKRTKRPATYAEASVRRADVVAGPCPDDFPPEPPLPAPRAAARAASAFSLARRFIRCS
jgi:hypothetical protein